MRLQMLLVVSDRRINKVAVTKTLKGHGKGTVDHMGEFGVRHVEKKHEHADQVNKVEKISQ